MSDAPTPTPRRVCQGRLGRCGLFLGYAPVPVWPSGAAWRAPDHPDGHDWVRCPRCGMWNVFRAAVGTLVA